jgi:citrate synthase
MGHAVYKTYDPRAKILREMSKKLGNHIGNMKWYNITSEIERITQEEFQKQKGRNIYPNVDLYSASVYYMMGIEPDLYTAIFAMSRIAGWAAHVIEERYPKPPVKPVIYRPSSTYQGEYCGRGVCDYKLMEER